MNLTRRFNGSINLSSQMPRSPTVPQPRRSTLVDSTTTSPAPPAANLPAFIRCQSVGNPFAAEYWCIGGTTTRFLSFTPRIENGENSINPDMAPNPRDFCGYGERYRPGREPQTGNICPAKTSSPASHANLGWREVTGRDTREQTTPNKVLRGRTS